VSLLVGVDATRDLKQWICHREPAIH
jgi:hypothetical protein